MRRNKHQILPKFLIEKVVNLLLIRGFQTQNLKPSKTINRMINQLFGNSNMILRALQINLVWRRNSLLIWTPKTWQQTWRSYHLEKSYLLYRLKISSAYLRCSLNMNSSLTSFVNRTRNSQEKRDWSRIDEPTLASSYKPWAQTYHGIRIKTNLKLQNLSRRSW